MIGKSNPQLRLKILAGGVKVKKTDIQILANAKHKDRIVIKNEADLYNKAKNLRDEKLRTKFSDWRMKKLKGRGKYLVIHLRSFLRGMSGLIALKA